MQAMDCALDLALANAGNSRPARIAMMAMTTRSSMSVNALTRVYVNPDSAPIGGDAAAIRDPANLRGLQTTPSFSAWWISRHSLSLFACGKASARGRAERRPRRLQPRTDLAECCFCGVVIELCPFRLSAAVAWRVQHFGSPEAKARARAALSRRLPW